MRAAQIREFGSADNFEIVEVPVPTMKDDEVLIKVAVAGVLYADIQLRSGTYKRFQYELPTVPGHEVVGTIVDVGAQVEGLTAGMRVSAELTSGGAYAEYATASPRRVIPLPDGVPFEKAIVYSFNLPAAYLIYNNFAAIPSHATVLIHSGAGGLGGMLTRVAKREGNRVISLVSSDHKRDACLMYGADHVIDTSSSDYVDEVLKVTDGRGVDVSFNHVGGATMRKDLEVLVFRGFWFSVNTRLFAGFANLDSEFLTAISNKCPTIVQSSSATLFGTDEHTEALEYMQTWLTTEELDSPSRTYPLEDLASAQRWMESRQSVGKIGIVL